MASDGLINLDHSVENKKRVEDLASLLKPGLPVLVKNSRHNHGCGFAPLKQVHTYLFLSDGLLKGNKLSVLKGARNYVYAEIYDNHFCINRLRDEYPVVEFTESFFSQHHEFNEGTFSRDGPSSWISTCSGGSEVIVGGGLFEKFKDVLTSLRFASDSVYVNVSGVIGNSVFEQVLVKGELERVNELIRVNRVVDLIDKNHHFMGGLNVRLVDDNVRKRLDLPVGDYVIANINTAVATVLVKPTFFYSDVYVMPFNDYTQVVVDALK